VLGGTAACSLVVDTSGLTGAPPAEAGPPEAAADATSAPPPDAEGDDDADAGALVDAETCDAAAVAYDLPLTATLDPLLARSLRVSTYPKVEPFFGDVAAVLYPFVDPSPMDAGPDAAPTYRAQYTGAHSGLWIPAAVPLGAFDVTVDVHVRCTSTSSCADGLIVAWLETERLEVLTNASTGHVGGLPSGTDGAAVVLDDFQNPPEDVADPAAPTLQVIQLDATKPVGKYPWHVAAKATSFLGGWHTVAVTARRGVLDVRFDGALRVSAVTRPFARGLFGITAGTGGETNAVAVRNLRATFRDCP